MIPTTIFKLKSAAAGAAGVPPQPAPVSAAQLGMEHIMLCLVLLSRPNVFYGSALIEKVLDGCPSYVTDDTKAFAQMYMEDHQAFLQGVQSRSKKAAYGVAFSKFHQLDFNSIICKDC